MAKGTKPPTGFPTFIEVPMRIFWRVFCAALVLFLCLAIPVIRQEFSFSTLSPSNNNLSPDLHPMSQAVTSTRQYTYTTTEDDEIIPTHIQVVLTWLPTACDIRGCWDNLDHARFHLHGLWPTDNLGRQLIDWDNLGRQLLDCPKAAREGGLQIANLHIDTINGLFNYWPSYEKSSKNHDEDSRTLWVHEYKKHGRCAKAITKRDWENYFIRGVIVMQTIRDQFDMEGLLQNAGIVPDPSIMYTSTEFEEAIEPLIRGSKIIFRCVHQIYLRELILCMDLAANNFISCPDSSDSFRDWDCATKNLAIFKPQPPPPPPKP